MIKEIKSNEPISVNGILTSIETIRVNEKEKTIDECIKAINDLNIEYAYPHTICNVLEMLKENNNE